MGGGKLPPRQKMIGMMYLVLTALLAMNVSKDILNAFIVVNEGLQKTNHNFEDKNKQTLGAFEKLIAKDPKAAGYLKKAKEAQKAADEINKYIDELKVFLVMETDKKSKEAADTLIEKMIWIDAKDNYDKPTEILIGAEPANPKPATEKWSALELKSKIDETKAKFIKCIQSSADAKMLPDVVKSLEKSLKGGLNTDISGMENGVKVDWAGINFYHLPLAAVITNLTKIQSDIDNAEADIINSMYNNVGATDVKISGFVAEVIAKSSYVLAGDSYEAEVLLVAQSASTKPRIFVGQVDTAKKTLIGTGEPLEVVSGVGAYKKVTGGEGLQKFGGIIELDKPDGTTDKYPFMAEYMVAKPAAAVSPDKMNVFYIGVDNPVTISAAGVAPENLAPSLSGGGGSLSGSRGKYNVKVSSGTECSINVNAKFGATSKSMGAFKFRVKRLPDPYAFVAQKKGDAVIKKGELVAAGGVVAKFENFDFDLKVTVVSFDVELVMAGDLKTLSTQGNAFSAQQQAAIQGAKIGSKVYFSNIKARLPDGSTRSLPSVSFKLTV